MSPSAALSRRPSVKRWVDRPRLRVWLPSTQAESLALLRSAFGSQVRLRVLDGAFWLTRRYLPRLVPLLAREFGAVDVRLQFVKGQRCTVRCRTADPETFYDCTCSCLALRHGGDHTGPSWLREGDVSTCRGLQTLRLVVTDDQLDGLPSSA
ncbi:MAG TPA: hypothetical protein VIL00_05815 [Pseudonocardiaceae bacterium]